MASSAVMVFKLLFYIFACEECINCAIVDLSGEAVNLLKSYGIENPTSNERKVAKNFILEKRDEKIRVDEKIFQKEEQIRNLTQDVKELSNRNGKLESDKKFCEKNLAQCYGSVKIRGQVERVELLIGVPEKRPAFIDSVKEEVIDEIRKKVTKKGVVGALKEGLDDYLEKRGAFADIDDKESDAFQKTRAQVEYHYGLWRWFLAYSEHPIAQFFRQIWKTEAERKHGCAAIACIYIFASNQIHILGELDYELTNDQVLEGLKRSGLNDEYTLEIAKYLLKGIPKPKP